MRVLSLVAGVLTLLCVLPGCDPEALKGDSAQDTAGTDTDTPSVEDGDADGDTILDSVETSTDTDGDGTPDFEDTDSDDDGVPDSVEAGDSDPSTEPVDSDGDGTWDTRDVDSDDNCVLDADESGGASPVDTDGDGSADYVDIDNDGDGIADALELGSGCDVLDTDLDGVADYLDDDSDADGLADAEETAVDSDGDGRPDFQDVDSDNDGLQDRQEADDYGTDPRSRDTDGDGQTDAAEVAGDADPNDASVTLDGLYIELAEGADGDLSLDVVLRPSALDVLFLLEDTTHNETNVDAFIAGFDDVIGEISALSDDFQYGIATWQDYAYGTYGTAGSDLPFRLVQQNTDNLREVRAAISLVSRGDGGDPTSSGHEAILQALTGVGYDQNCDKTYDPATDVLPFIAGPGDPFNGTAGSAREGGDESTGDEGGFGARENTRPVIIYFASGYLRDPDGDSDLYSGSPGGCPGDATEGGAVNAAAVTGATLIGVAAEGGDGLDQLETLAVDTLSLGDTDFDGDEDEPLVLEWDGSDMGELTDFIMAGMDRLYGTLDYETVSLRHDNDEIGFVSEITPTSYDVDPDEVGETVTFEISLRGAVAQTDVDQVFLVVFEVVADGSRVLESVPLIVVVPAE